MFACLAAAAALATAPMTLPELASRVQAEAVSLSREAPKAPASAGFLDKLNHFADDAMTLSSSLRAAGAPGDLPCIFKGISEDARAQAETLRLASTKTDRQMALDELLVLLDDAAALAPHAAHPNVAAPDPTDPVTANKAH
jgi:hypothetical protein